MESKHRETFWRFFLDQKEPNGLELHLGGAPTGAQPTRACLVGLACPGGLCSLEAHLSVKLTPTNPINRETIKG